MLTTVSLIEMITTMYVYCYWSC